MTCFVDTSAYVALTDEDDARHAEAAAILRYLVTGPEPLVTSQYVVIETVSLLQRRFGMRAVRRFVLDLLPSAEVLWVTPTVHAAATAALLERWPEAGVAGRPGQLRPHATSRVQASIRLR